MYTSNIYTYTGGELWQHRAVHQIRNSESLSFLFCIHTSLFFIIFSFLLQISDLTGKAVGESTPAEAENLKVGGLESHLILLLGWQNSVETEQFYCCYQREGFACPFPQKRLFSKAQPLWVMVLLSLQLWQEQSWLSLLLTGRSLSCLPTRGKFAVGTRMKPRCWWPELRSELPECWVQTQLWPGIMKEKCC